jgi:hypothetical protein
MKNDILRYGDFVGTLAEFAAKVEETHKVNFVYLGEYRAMIEFFKRVAAARWYLYE